MTTRHALVCLPPAPADGIVARLHGALSQVRRGQFDSYEITTGRYTSHFPLVDGAQSDDPRLVRSPESAAGRCAGGRVGLLDLAALRDRRATEAADLYDAWAQATDGMPRARPWSEFAETSNDAFSALLAFREQPQLQTLSSIKGWQGHRCRDEEAALVCLDRAAFVARARRRAVPGNSLLRLDGTWSTDPAWLNADDCVETGSTVYYDHANAYLDALPDDHMVVSVDCRR